MKLKHRIAAATFAVLAAGAATAGAASAASDAKANPREVKYVKSVAPHIADLSAALRKGDIVSARAAYESYDATWNGIEVYINFRNLPLYQALELDLQNKIAAGLAQAQPSASTLLPISEQLGAKYNEAIAMAKQGPALSPLFDDLAALRVVRADLRIVTAALTAGDYVKAQEEFTIFRKNYPGVRGLVKQRSTTVDKEITDADNAADAAFRSPTTTVDALKPIIATATARYNYAVNLWNAAARNADVNKTDYTDADTKNASLINDVRRNLTKSLTAWNSGNYPAAAQAAADATTAFTTVQPVLAAKGSDASLRTTLASYSTLAAAAGSSTTVAASNKAAVEAANVAEQVLVGQFWGDAKLQKYLSGLPTS